MPAGWKPPVPFRRRRVTANLDVARGDVIATHGEELMPLHEGTAVTVVDPVHGVEVDGHVVICYPDPIGGWWVDVRVHQASRRDMDPGEAA